jgi:hypothetical protein
VKTDSSLDAVGEIRALVSPLDPVGSAGSAGSAGSDGKADVDGRADSVAAPGVAHVTGAAYATDAELTAAAPPIAAIFRRAEQMAPEPQPQVRWTRQRIVRWGTPVVLGGLAAGAIAAVALRSQAPATQKGDVRCFTVGHVTTDPHYFTDAAPAVPAGGAPLDVSATVAAAIDQCAGLWKVGLLQPTGLDQNFDNVPDHPVPALAACVLDDGTAAVLPGDDQTCRRLNLPRLIDRLGS